jgi:hypothetical protein
MNCKQTNDLIVEYLYGELRLEQRASVQAHLEACLDCRARLEGLTAAREWVAGLPEQEPTPTAVHRIVARAREEDERSRLGWGLGWLKIFVPISFMIVVGGLVAHYHWSGQLIKEKAIEPTPREQREVVSQGGAQRYIGDEGKQARARSNLPSPWKDMDSMEAGELGNPSRSEQPREGKNGALSEPSGPPERESEASMPYSLKRGAAPERSQEGEPLGGVKGEQAQALRVPLEEGKGREEAPGRKFYGKLQTEAAPEYEARAISEASALTPLFDALYAGEFKQAREGFQNAIDTMKRGDSERPLALYGLALAYEGLGEPDKAREIYRLLLGGSPALRDLALSRLKALSSQEGK